MHNPAKRSQRTYICIDYTKCTGCRTCEMVCAITHGSTAPSHSRIKVDSHYPGIDIPSLCMHCIDPPCFVCTFGAMTVKNGVVLIDGTECVGCEECAETCPLGAIALVESKAVKCDLCGKCVEFCPTNALSLCETAEEADLSKPDEETITERILGVRRV
jgi:carbon-monoxide dehydrogenase iron sulfur subunit